MSGPQPRGQTINSQNPAAPADTASSGAAGDSTPDTGAESYQPRTADDLPAVFGRYRVIRKLGAGGMGAVYLAHDTHLDGPLALKVPHGDCVENAAAVERFYREARAAFALRRVPGVCQIRDVGQIDGRHYLALDYIEGQPLTAVARSLSIPDAVDLIRRLALTLHAAHTHGIVHRDLKPANVMLDDTGAPIVMDFGLARRDGSNEPRLTHSGAVLGTPVYMPPEQVKGTWEQIGPWTDVYSLGIMLYEMLTGELPFGGSVFEILGQILAVEPAPPSQINSALDAELESVCLKAMAKAVEDRFASMAEFAAALEQWLAGRPADSPASTLPAAMEPAPHPSPLAVASLHGAAKRGSTARESGAASSRPSLSATDPGGGSGDAAARGQRLWTRRPVRAAAAVAVIVIAAVSWLINASPTPGDGGQTSDVSRGELASAPPHTAGAGSDADPAEPLEGDPDPADSPVADGAPVDSALAILPIAAQVVDEEQALRVPVELRAVLPGGVVPEFSLGPGAPAGCTIDRRNGTVTWTPTEDQGPESYVVTVRVRVPGRDELSDERPFAVTVREVNRAPVLGTLDEQQLAPGGQLQVNVSATDPDRPRNVLRYGLATAPAGATIDANTGLLAWKSAADLRPGRYAIPVRVTDDGDPPLSESGVLRVTVEEPLSFENSLGMTLLRIEPGEFQMGSPATEAGRGDDEQQHRVRITKAFYLGSHEVTVGQFRRFVDGAKYQTEPERDGEGGWGWNETEGKLESHKPEYTWRNTGWPQTEEHPVLNVTWNDAVAFCNWLSRQEQLAEFYRLDGDAVVVRGGAGYRLPTEAEWEYACRAGTTTAYWHGDDPEGLAQVGNVADGTAKARLPNDQSWTYISARDGHVFTAPVESFRPNAWGLFDMHGNVWEWCADWYDSGYYVNSPAHDPLGPQRGSSRVYRGGGWLSAPRNARSAYRSWGTRGHRNGYLGFRLARSLSGQVRE